LATPCLASLLLIEVFLSKGRLEKVSILIVDDEKLIQRLVTAVLESLGFKSLVIANNGQKAIELLSTQRFDLIITDWRMPDMDGLEFINFVRHSPKSFSPRIPIIFLTGNTEVHHVLTARDAGVNEYMIKPFTAEQLVKRIRSVIEHPRSFVDAFSYRGPDRRRKDIPPYGGVDRRKNVKK